jgi:hypothetical protein
MLLLLLVLLFWLSNARKSIRFISGFTMQG